MDLVIHSFLFVYSFSHSVFHLTSICKAPLCARHPQAPEGKDKLYLVPFQSLVGEDILNRQTEKSVMEIVNSDVQIAVETQKMLTSILNKDLKMKTSKRR